MVWKPPRPWDLVTAARRPPTAAPAMGPGNVDSVGCRLGLYKTRVLLPRTFGKHRASKATWTYFFNADPSL